MDIIPARSYLSRENHSRFWKQIARYSYVLYCAKFKDTCSHSKRYQTYHSTQMSRHVQHPHGRQMLHNYLHVGGLVMYIFSVLSAQKSARLDFLLGLWPQHKNTQQPTEPPLPYPPYPLSSFVLSLQATVDVAPDLGPAAFRVQWAHMQGARHRVCASHRRYSCLGCQCIPHQKI